MAFRTINVEFRFHEQSGMLFLWTINPCQEEVRFERGIPVSIRSGHGIGVQSICAIVERHGGYQFSVEGGRFILLNGEEYNLQVAYDFSVEDGPSREPPRVWTSPAWPPRSCACWRRAM